ncbi:hypothetical protein [uncultured Clostridium sp.]|uniref:hypothetical protein n=1 Tax=uncultured Clostridium sp. TaxID=59620 RepID=UPI0025DA98A1|nr:hypothetical protein [uncultured Clostridium sp.]MDU4323850.1 hypothetical protein [Clostridium celatum]
MLKKKYKILKRLVIIGTTHHKNIGDYAIAVAEDINEIPNLINELKLLRGCKYNNRITKEYYNSIYD